MLKALASSCPGGTRWPHAGANPEGRRARLAGGAVRKKAPGQPDAIYGRLAAGLPSIGGPGLSGTMSPSATSRISWRCGLSRHTRIRVPRVVSVADCGRVISPRTAASQVRGGVVWGIGAALREASEVDPRYGGFLNADLAEYVVPVNADIGSIEVEFIDKPDFKFNSRRRQGLGEVSMVGVAPAIANAVYHATGRRAQLPIRIEHLL